MQIRESAENYLETILILSQRKGKGEVRSIDIVNELEFSKPSVSVAMKNLRENGYITVDKDGYIRLTDKGLEIAAKDSALITCSIRQASSTATFSSTPSFMSHCESNV